MTVVLVSTSGDDMVVNWWSWRPTVAMLVRAGVLPAGEREERRLLNGCGGYLSASEALRAAECVEALIASIAPGQRVLSNGQVTDEPIDYNMPIAEWDQAETWNRYSAKYDVLAKFAEFCRCSRGFEVH